MIEVDDFRGVMPRIDEQKLPVPAAVEAVNLRIMSGNLEAWDGLDDVVATLVPGVIRSTFLYEGQYWFSSNGRYDVIRSPIAQDPYARVYFTESTAGAPKVTSNLIALDAAPFPTASYDLGVPAPDSAITCSVNVDGGADPEDFSARRNPLPRKWLPSASTTMKRSPVAFGSMES